MSGSHNPIWFPNVERMENSSLMRLMRRFGEVDYEGLRVRALRDTDAYWREVIADLGLSFRKPFENVLDLTQGPQWPHWFSGGRLNFTDSLLDGGSSPVGSDEIAIRAYSEDRPCITVSREALRHEVEQAMARLRSLGVSTGDRVALLLPNIVEAAFVLIATARLGAVVVPLYSGFGPDAIASRVNASGAKVLVTCDGFVRNGKALKLKPVADAALTDCPSIARVAIIRRLGEPSVEMNVSRDCWWDELPADEVVASPDLDPNDPWMIIFTSGTTGRPKGTVHTHGGFPFRVAHDTAYQFDFQAGDNFFWYSDMGWMIGPLSICAPLILGGSLVLYDGGPTVPDAARLLCIASDAAVTHYGTSPTMLRLMASAFPVLREGLAPNVKVLMTAGEVIDEETFGWFHREIGRSRTPIINYTGGTEVSGGILSNIVIRPISPGTFNAVVTDVAADVADEGNNSIFGSVGELVLRRPMLGMTRGLWEEPDRYLESYWEKRPGIWSHGDLTIRHSEELWELRGRADDVLKISGRRVGPTEIEDAALSEGSIVAAAAIGVPDFKSGQSVVLLAVPRDSTWVAEAAMAQSIQEHVGRKLGPGLRPKAVVIVRELPRTRNAKILRRLVRSILLGDPLGDISSLENPSAIDELRAVAGRLQTLQIQLS